MAPSRPRVITDVQLAEFVQSLLDNDSQSSTLVVCASKETFVEHLLAASLNPRSDNSDDQPPNDAEQPPDKPTKTEPHVLLERPSLLRLTKSRTVKLVFCLDIIHLRAYLAKLAIPSSQLASNLATKPSDASKPHGSILAILNPIDIHRSTSSFSAQGLNRTFSLAVEAAHATASQLLMAECQSFGPRNAEDMEAEYEFEPEAVLPPPPTDPWNEEVSILNVTTKSFGAGGRGWVGRTVTVRRIAERWCVFSAFQSGHDRRSESDGWLA